MKGVELDRSVKESAV